MDEGKGGGGLSDESMREGMKGWNHGGGSEGRGAKRSQTWSAR